MHQPADHRRLPQPDPRVAASTTATGTTSAGWGDYTGRLARVDFTAYRPGTGMTTTPVASYAYDSARQLRGQWDPRISPALKTTYDYGTGNRLTTVTPPGLAAWSIGYDGSNRVTTFASPPIGMRWSNNQACSICGIASACCQTRRRSA